MWQVFMAGSISPNTEARPDIFSHFTLDELCDLYVPENNSIYFYLGISSEAGDCYSAIANSVTIPDSFLSSVLWALPEWRKDGTLARFTSAGHLTR